MAVGDPITLGSLATNGIFLMTSETGIIIDNYTRNTSSKKFEFYDGSVGNTTGVTYYDFVAVYTIKGAVNGTTGVMGAAVGTALTFNNTATGAGVSQGGIYVDSVDINHTGGQLREVTVGMTQRNNIA